MSSLPCNTTGGVITMRAPSAWLSQDPLASTRAIAICIGMTKIIQKIDGSVRIESAGVILFGLTLEMPLASPPLEPLSLYWYGCACLRLSRVSFYRFPDHIGTFGCSRPHRRLDSALTREEFFGLESALSHSDLRDILRAGGRLTQPARTGILGRPRLGPLIAAASLAIFRRIPVASSEIWVEKR